MSTLISVLKQGQIVTVSQRRFVVQDVLTSTLPPSPLSPQTDPQCSVTLNTIEDDALGETLQVVWELEQGARYSEQVDLPEKTTYPRRFDMLVVDAAHNVAPAESGHYAINSRRTTESTTIGNGDGAPAQVGVCGRMGWQASFSTAPIAPDRSRLLRGGKTGTRLVEYTVLRQAATRDEPERYAEEVRAGLHGKKKRRSREGDKRKKAKRDEWQMPLL